jgi:PTH1 family peptidyl-tRNA hydrolase
MPWLRAIFKRLFPGRGLSEKGAGSADFVIVGIGNPGGRYTGTRHNVGYEVVDRLRSVLSAGAEFRAFDAQMVTGELEGGIKIACAKPGLYVNRSGIVVRKLIDFYGTGPSRCLVIVDDFNLALGRIRLRRQGSDGGHNGLKSIIAEIGDGFPRVRVGVGPLPLNTSSVDFVLGRFTDSELERRETALVTAAGAVDLFCRSGIEAAMNRYNR